MIINLQGVGKKFVNEWIFRNVEAELSTGNRYAIVGHNGSGKSTLLKVMAGIIPLTTGRLTYSREGKTLEADELFRHLAIASPYLELIEELTLGESIDFHRQFKHLSIGKQELIDKLAFPNALHKAIKHFSSGMRQKLKLALALYSASDVLLLDEPTANFDTTNIDWYLREMEQQPAGRLTVICSNQKYEYESCNQVIELTRFKR